MDAKLADSEGAPLPGACGHLGAPKTHDRRARSLRHALLTSLNPLSPSPSFHQEEDKRKHYPQGRPPPCRREPFSLLEPSHECASPANCGSLLLLAIDRSSIYQENQNRAVGRPSSNTSWMLLRAPEP